MNLWQKLVLGATLIAVAWLVLYPPWYYEYKYDPPVGMRGVGTQQLRITRPAGHHPLWNGIPNDQSLLIQMFAIPPDKSDLRYFTMRIDKDILTVEIVGVLVGCILLCALLRTRRINST